MASGMIGWIQDHPDLALAGGVVGVLLVAGSIFKAKTGVPGTAGATQDLSGLKNGIVYVPTQTTFQTINRTQSGVFASNDPALTSVTAGPVNSPTTTTTTGGPGPAGPPGTPGPAGPPGPRQPPPPKPNPPPTTRHLIWDQGYTIVGGDTLSAIAARLTPKLRAQGMPGSMSLTWTDLWQHNQGVVTKYANMHGHYRNVWDWVFPGERITVPRWG
jgi:hypothetical protein